MRLKKIEKEVIYDALKRLWDVYYDRPYYERGSEKSNIRERLLLKFEAELNEE